MGTPRARLIRVTYADLAKMRGVEIATVKQDAYRKRFDPHDLVSVFCYGLRREQHVMRDRLAGEIAKDLIAVVEKIEDMIDR
jgi:hypothetical protein